jgi:hypothetical protein
MACIEESTKTEGEGSLKTEERTFGLSIERFKFFWWLYAEHFRLPDRLAFDFWAVVALVRAACEEAQHATRSDVWALRARRREALERLKEAGAPIPPELEEAVNPTPKLKLKPRNRPRPEPERVDGG